MEFSAPDQINHQHGPYEETLKEAHEITRKPFVSAGLQNIQRQHLKDRMTVWERIKVLTPNPPKVLFQNWGPDLDGASLVTAVLNIEGRDIAVYGHDFTVRAADVEHASFGDKGLERIDDHVADRASDGEIHVRVVPVARIERLVQAAGGSESMRASGHRKMPTCCNVLCTWPSTRGGGCMFGHLPRSASCT